MFDGVVSGPDAFEGLWRAAVPWNGRLLGEELTFFAHATAV